MPVDLQFFNEESLLLKEIDVGESRINYGTITPIKIKNNGKDKARNVIISADTVDSLEDLRKSMSEENAIKEYNKQYVASKWKTFSLSQDGVFKDSLELGNIDAESFLKGSQTINESFVSKEDCLFQNVWSYCLESMGNGGLKIYKEQARSQTAQRKEIAIGKKRDVSIQFKVNYEYDSNEYANNSCIVLFPVRIGETGTGYGLSFQFRAKDGKCFFGVYKNAKGMVSNLSRTYGTRIIDTNGYLSFDPNKYMGIKIYNDEDDNVWFELTIDGKPQKLYLTGNKNVSGEKIQDPNNTHPNAGNMYYDVGMYYGDLAVTLSNFQITTETDQQIVYIKSKLDSQAIDDESYISAITLSYVER